MQRLISRADPTGASIMPEAVDETVVCDLGPEVSGV